MVAMLTRIKPVVKNKKLSVMKGASGLGYKVARSHSTITMTVLCVPLSRNSLWWAFTGTTGSYQKCHASWLFYLIADCKSLSFRCFCFVVQL
jgi:hypothetical protein